MLAIMFQAAAAGADGGTDWARAFVDAIPAFIAFGGIVVGLVWNQIASGRRWERERAERQEAWAQEREEGRRARDHDHELERNRLLRADRLALYRRLVDAAGDVLTRTSGALSMPSDADRHKQAMESNATWAAVLAESRLLAADPVYNAAVAVENRRKEWLDDRNRLAMDPFWRKLIDAPSVSAPAPPDEAKEESYWQRIARDLQQQNERTTDGDALITELVDRCKEDIKQLRA